MLNGLWKKVTFVHTDEQEFQHTSDTIYKVYTCFNFSRFVIIIYKVGDIRTLKYVALTKSEIETFD